MSVIGNAIILGGGSGGSGGGEDTLDAILTRTISGTYENSRITNIGAYAFYSCSSLTTASFPACTTIGSYAFGHCSILTTASFPACTTIDGFFVFYNCSKIASLSFPACTTIGGTAFRLCIRLRSLYLYNSVVASLTHTNAFLSTPISNYTGYTNGKYGSIFVKSSLLTSWQTATNWATYSSRFVGNG